MEFSVMLVYGIVRMADRPLTHYSSIFEQLTYALPYKNSVEPTKDVFWNDGDPFFYQCVGITPTEKNLLGTTTVE